MATRKTTVVKTEVENEVIEKPVRRTKRSLFKGVVTNCQALNVRTEPNTDSNIVDVLNIDTQVKILEIIEGWYKIDNGYVMSDFIEISK